MEGDNYSVSNNFVTPDLNFNGQLIIPIKVNNGIFDSEEAELIAEISAVNDIPVIVNVSESFVIQQGTSLTLELDDFSVEDPDNNFPTDFSLKVQSGDNYTTAMNVVTPEAEFTGDLDIILTVSDGLDDSEPFTLSIMVTEILSLNNQVPGFLIYPNPTKDYIIVQSENSLEVKIYDLQGILKLEDKVIPTRKNTIDVSNFSRGLYILEIITESKDKSLLFLKE